MTIMRITNLICWVTKPLTCRFSLSGTVSNLTENTMNQICGFSEVLQTFDSLDSVLSRHRRIVLAMLECEELFLVLYCKCNASSVDSSTHLCFSKTEQIQKSWSEHPLEA